MINLFSPFKKQKSTQKEINNCVDVKNFVVNIKLGNKQNFFPLIIP